MGNEESGMRNEEREVRNESVEKSQEAGGVSSNSAASSLRLPVLSCMLLLLFLALYRLVLNVYTPLMDPSESRYAVFAKNMAESGNWWTPTYNYYGAETVFVGKPPLAFQMSLAFCKMLGISIFATRIPAFLSAVLILWLVWRNVKKWRDVQCAQCAILLTCCSFLFFMYAGQTMTDLILTATITGAIFSYIGFEQELAISNDQLAIDASATPKSPATRTDRVGSQLEVGRAETGLFGDKTSSSRPCGSAPQLAAFYSVMFFVWIALGVLIKGPVAIVMSGLPVFFYVLINNRWKNLKYHAWVLGTIAFIAIIVPYYWIVSIKHPDFLQYFIIEENFNRFLFKGSASRFGTARESFYGVSFVWFLVLNLPTVFLLQLYPSKNRKRIYVWSLFKDPLTGMSALTCISLVLFWALTSRVLITYLLPTIPFFAVFLATRFTDAGLMKQDGFVKKIYLFLISWLLLLPALFTAAVYMGVYYSAELASPIVADAVKTIENHPEFSDRDYYFAVLSPHFAEYYYKSKTKFHDMESFKSSLENSKNDWLFVTERQEKDYNNPVNRKLVYQKGQWRLYAPEEINDPTPQAGNVENDSNILPDN